MLFNMGFGALSLSDEYVSIKVPDEVKNFVGGAYVSGKWNKEVPTNRAVQDYEAKAKWLIDNVFENFNSFKDGNATLSYASQVANDIDYFRNYMKIKKQVEKNWGSMDATNWFYTNYFSTFQNYATLTDWLSRQSTLALQEIMDNATIMMAELKSGMTSQKMSFYLGEIVPIASKLTKDEQMFLRDIFVLKMDGQITLDDLIKAIRIIAPHLTMAQFSPIYNFATMAILGHDLGNGVLNATVASSYYSRNVQAELAQITNQYRTVASRLGPHLNPETEALFQERLKIHRAGYDEPNNPKYYVCGPVCSEIMNNLRTPITDAVKELSTLTKDYPKTAILVPTIPTEEKIREVVAASGGTEADVQALIKEQTAQTKELKDLESYVTDETDDRRYLTNREQTSVTNKSNLPVILGLGFLLLLLLGKEEK